MQNLKSETANKLNYRVTNVSSDQERTVRLRTFETGYVFLFLIIMCVCGGGGLACLQTVYTTYILFVFNSLSYQTVLVQ